MDRFMEGSKKENLTQNQKTEHDYEGRENYEMDIDRMINEGLGGGYVGDQNGHIGDTSVDDM